MIRNRSVISRRLLAQVAALLLSAVARAAAQDPRGPTVASSGAERPELRAARAGAVRLDGRLDDPQWATADSIELTQTEPREGAPASARTVVRVLVTADAVLIGIRCDQGGTRIVGFARQRDASLDNEDHVKIVLDTYGDGRSGYVFAVNPNGARYDALVTNEGEDENANWDGAWEAATAYSTTGWSVELAIPARTLLFRPGLDAWGFNVERRIQRLQETDRWSGASRDLQVTQTQRAGLLTGVPPFELGIDRKSVV